MSRNIPPADRRTSRDRYTPPSDRRAAPRRAVTGAAPQRAAPQKAPAHVNLELSRPSGAPHAPVARSWELHLSPMAASSDAIKREVLAAPGNRFALARVRFAKGRPAEVLFNFMGGSISLARGGSPGRTFGVQFNARSKETLAACVSAALRKLASLELEHGTDALFGDDAPPELPSLDRILDDQAAKDADRARLVEIANVARAVVRETLAAKVAVELPEGCIQVNVSAAPAPEMPSITFSPTFSPTIQAAPVHVEVMPSPAKKRTIELQDPFGKITGTITTGG